MSARVRFWVFKMGSAALGQARAMLGNRMRESVSKMSIGPVATRALFASAAALVVGAICVLISRMIAQGSA